MRFLVFVDRCGSRTGGAAIAVSPHRARQLQGAAEEAADRATGDASGKATGRSGGDACHGRTGRGA
ncbi:hypothetical protein, partial [Nocardia sp. NPDC004722]